MVLLHLVMMHQKGAHCINLLNLINIRVKAEEFYRNYSPLFLQTLFAVYFDLIHHETSTRITEIDLWIGENYLRELATFLQGKNVEPLIGEHLIQAFPGKVTL